MQRRWEGLKGSNIAHSRQLTRRLRMLQPQPCPWLLQQVAHRIQHLERGRSKELRTLTSMISCKDRPSLEGRLQLRARAKEVPIRSIWKPMKLTTTLKITHCCSVRHAVRSWRKTVKLLTNSLPKLLAMQLLRIKKTPIRLRPKEQLRNQKQPLQMGKVLTI